MIGFRAALAAQGLSVPEFAAITGQDVSPDDVPPWAWLLLQAWRMCPDALTAARWISETPHAIDFKHEQFAWLQVRLEKIAVRLDEIATSLGAIERDIAAIDAETPS